MTKSTKQTKKAAKSSGGKPKTAGKAKTGTSKKPVALSDFSPPKRRKIVSLAEYEAEAKRDAAAGAADVGPTADKAGEPNAQPTQPAGGNTAATGRKTSGLDAAVIVLAEAGTPLNCVEMVKRMLDGGLWKTNGKTPAATIYAAIVREITVKGDASRFRKTDRGHFELTPAGIAARSSIETDAN